MLSNESQGENPAFLQMNQKGIITTAMPMITRIGDNCHHGYDHFLDGFLIWCILQKQSDAMHNYTPSLDSRLCAKLRPKAIFRNHIICRGDGRKWPIGSTLKEVHPHEIKGCLDRVLLPGAVRRLSG